EPHINLITGLEYNRMMTKSPRLQGYNESGQDYWMLTLGREFFKNKLSLSLMYVLPLEWGVRETQNSLTEANFYREATHLNLDTYKNMIFLRATLHLHKGKKTKESKSKSSFDDESRENRGLL
ncbi:MAG: hypothetical protein KBH23_04835, partial [Bacteroidaceae bacterium]|nr:hypothetical protein [Bacteroidaceae bacterium]